MRARNPNSTVSGCGFCSATDEHSSALTGPYRAVWRQKVIDATGRLSRQSLQHILQVTVRVEPVELSGSYEAHDYCGALPRTQ